MEAIVAGPTDPAQAIATTVVAEALETEEQAAKLKEMEYACNDKVIYCHLAWSNRHQHNSSG